MNTLIQILLSTCFVLFLYGIYKDVRRHNSINKKYRNFLAEYKKNYLNVEEIKEIYGSSDSSDNKKSEEKQEK